MKSLISPFIFVTLVAVSMHSQAAETPAAAPETGKPAESMNKIMKPCSDRPNVRRGMGMMNRGAMHAEMEKIINTEDPEERRKLFAAHTEKMHGDRNFGNPFMPPGRFSREIEQAERRQAMENMMRNPDPEEQAKLQKAYQQGMQRRMQNRMSGMRSQGEPAFGRMMPPQGQMTPPPPGPGTTPNWNRGFAKHQFYGPSPEQQKNMLQQRIQMLEQQLGQMKNQLQQLQ